jgi:ribonuclease HII
VIGLDEAGYGPNLGPLCLGASVWLVPEHLEVDGLASSMIPIFQPLPLGKSRPHTWIPLGDSKKIFHGSNPLRNLAVGIACFLELSGKTIPTSLDLLQTIAEAESLFDAEQLPWLASEWHLPDDPSHFPNLHADFDPHLIREAQGKFQELELRLLGMHALLVDERRFNQQLEQWGNKATLLTSRCLGFLSEKMKAVLEVHPEIESIEIFADKHGGRNRYQSALVQFFPDSWFTTEIESPGISRYRFQVHQRPATIQFQARGDAIVPTSLASMAAKWCREMMMARLNRYWQDKFPGIKPTAGYPVDAARFSSLIQDELQANGFVRDDWWRRA